MRTANLTKPESADLRVDIERRFEIQRTMAGNTKPVLSLEFDVSEVVVWQIETGIYSSDKPYKVAPDVEDAIRRRRAIWHLAREMMQEYQLEALAEKYSISVNSVCRHAALIRNEWIRAQIRRRAA